MGPIPPRHVGATVALSCILALSGCQPRDDLQVVAARYPPGSLRGVVEALAAIDPPRNAEHPESLERAASFIAARMSAAGLTPELQAFDAESVRYHNVSALHGTGDRARVVVGAHYDVFGPNPGADDNASGVAALLHVASKLSSRQLPVDVELVAYALEEPPHFRSESMGSAHHARALADAGVEVIGMLSLEMLGYYTDAPNTQEFPDPGLARFFPTTGNFIAVLARTQDAAMLERVRAAIDGANDLRAFALSGPPELAGLDQSDHLNYWSQGFPAVLITDTAFFRNPHYHKPTDRPETLDYVRLEKAADGVHAAVIDLASRAPAEN